MAIYRLLAASKFEPHEAMLMTEAYEKALIDLGITDRLDPQTEKIALAIVVLVREGETDSARLAKLAAKAVAPGSRGA